jgi:hypothetical protein
MIRAPIAIGTGGSTECSKGFQQMKTFFYLVIPKQTLNKDILFNEIIIQKHIIFDKNKIFN